MLTLRDITPATQLSTGETVAGNVVVWGFLAAGVYAAYKFYGHYKKNGYLRGASRRRRSKRRSR